MKKLVILALLPLAACIRIGAPPPPSLLTLTPAQTVPVGQVQNSGQTKSILVMTPTVPQELAVARVPVQATNTSLAYVKDAQWADQPNRLFARLLSDTVSARTGRIVLTMRQASVDPSAQLSGELRAFGMDATTNEAVVSFEAALIRVDRADAIEKRRFEARVPVTAINADTVAPAISQAANQVASEVADWVGR
jgi:cholesterol transport system auxiliary component